MIEYHIYKHNFNAKHSIENQIEKMHLHTFTVFIREKYSIVMCDDFGYYIARQFNSVCQFKASCLAFFDMVKFVLRNSISELWVNGRYSFWRDESRGR